MERRAKDEGTGPYGFLEPVVALAWQAGDEILRIYEAGFNVAHKEDKSPLTEADVASHETIERGLRALAPSLPVLSEESAAVDFAERSGWPRYWLVDPLDGTREFVKRNGEFTVNIALIEDHEPTLGVIVVPVNGLCYFACRGRSSIRARAGCALPAARLSAFMSPTRTPLATAPWRATTSTTSSRR